MNIKEAKQQVKNAIKAYFSKDDRGEYIIPLEKQRPVFLLGPPGIGKTAIMAQIAEEMGIGLVSYSMTHHTRQSALGLPFISQKTYGDMIYSVSEYTMSEIIASVYDLIEESGLEEGILFLDEINCVSETLAPVMLQFLQYKVFGRHRVPKGFIVVTAGNPPEYNNSVKEFDIVTKDRLKNIEIEPEFKVWKEYAVKSKVHPSILTYLEIKPDKFYKVESSAFGKSFVTARAWEDLSQMLHLYEKNAIEVDELLISQYVQERAISRDFANYYLLFKKYRSDYKIDRILAGEEDESILERAGGAKFDERLSLIGLIFDAISSKLNYLEDGELELKEYLSAARKLGVLLENEKAKSEKLLFEYLREKTQDTEKSRLAGAISDRLAICRLDVINRLTCLLGDFGESDTPFDLVKEDFSLLNKEVKDRAAIVDKALSNALRFCKRAFDGSQEILILLTELTLNPSCAMFLNRYGCKEYFKHSDELLFHERQLNIASELANINLDEDLDLDIDIENSARKRC